MTRPNFVLIMSDDHAAHAISEYGSVRRRSMYYRSWMHRDGAHNVPAHYGVRTLTHKLICYYNDPLDQPGAHGPADPVEWELFDLVGDPMETTNVIDDDRYAEIAHELRTELARLQVEVGDRPHPAAV